MKRKATLERALYWHLHSRGRKPKSVIAPRTVVRMIRKDSDMEGVGVGDIFRIGYYSKQDGPNCVWLVDDSGAYSQTWDQQSLLDYFEIVEQSGETDTYGVNRSPLAPR